MENWIPFLSYILLTAITPGPNNIMAMSNAGKYGFGKGLRFNVGVLLGFLMVLSACAAFTSLLFEFVPQIEPVMLCVGAAYILWLAWTVWQDRPHDENGHRLQANSIFSGMVLQFVNVKVILYGITGISAFLSPYYKGFFALLPFVLLMSFVGFASTCCWALFGAVFQRFFSRHKKLMNALLALLLVYCAVSQLWGLL